ncbi:MAG: radical SAM protein [Candidatus Odinarchaeota archaeon]
MSRLIRVSVGTAAVLKLVHCKLDALPTTAYTMTFSKNRCTANCAFCAQAIGSETKTNRLSRVTWPKFPLNQVINALSLKKFQAQFQRLCIQTTCYPSLIDDLRYLTETFSQKLPHIPLSLALPPIGKKQLQNFFDIGVDRIAISLDAITPTIFNKIKGTGVNGPFTWNQHFQALKSVLSVFGPGRTTTHLIIGLGETEKQAVNLIQKLTNQGITIGLFPFTPIAGTKLENHNRPDINHYRRIQLAHYLIQNHKTHAAQMQYNARNQLSSFGLPDKVLTTIITHGEAFQTAGCPSCNRPFFTEKPGGPLYNHPAPPDARGLNEIQKQLGGLL